MYTPVVAAPALETMPRMAISEDSALLLLALRMNVTEGVEPENPQDVLKSPPKPA
jgi:hypothetical protein